MRKLTRYSSEAFKGHGGLLRFFSQLDSEFTLLHRRMDTALKYKTSTQVIRVGTVSTRVRHALGRIPVGVRITPMGDARVWEVKDTRTTQDVFIMASSEVDAEVEVRG